MRCSEATSRRGWGFGGPFSVFGGLVVESAFTSAFLLSRALGPSLPGPVLAGWTWP